MAATYRGDEINRWEMESSTKRETYYTVKQWSGGELTCNCPRWRFQKGETRNCPHVEAIKAVMRMPIGALATASAAYPVPAPSKAVRRQPVQQARPKRRLIL